ncbi:MAG: GntR family transcriptional regulator [Oscillospiraceae bacterium]|nr:GntR family transcriptional regulator [Oscillospiraceae bacterium]
MNYKQHVPYYAQIQSHLMEMIKTMAPGELIPSETTLAKSFHVSRGTVKQAVMALVYEGILYRVQGKGTFVSLTKIPRSFDKLPTFTEDIRRMGHNSHSKILDFQEIIPNERVCGVFHLNPEKEETVFKFKRLVSLEDGPLAVVTSYLSSKIYPDLKVEEIGESLYGSLNSKYGRIPTKARDTYSIVSAAPKTAALLACKEGSPIFFSERVGYLADNRLAEYVESFIRSDRFKLDICIGFNQRNDEDQTLSEEDGQKQEGEHSVTHYGIGFRNVID